MATFEITVTETYVNKFQIEAETLEQAREMAESMAVERDFPAGFSESCTRDIETTDINADMKKAVADELTARMQESAMEAHLEFMATAK